MSKYVGIITTCNDQVDNKYKLLAKEVSDWLIEEDYNLIFGASSKGLMGVCYDEFIKNDKEVIAYAIKEYAYDLENLNKAKSVMCETTFDLKKQIFENSDLIVMLPGGIGTFSEFFAFIEEKRSCNKKTPIEIYDENGFYLQLLEILGTLVVNHFIDADIYDVFNVSHDKEEFINHIKGYKEKRKGR